MYICIGASVHSESQLVENAYRILYIEFKRHGDKEQTPKSLYFNSLISMYILNLWWCVQFLCVPNKFRHLKCRSLCSFLYFIYILKFSIQYTYVHQQECGSTISQVVSHQLPTSVVCVWSQFRLWQICIGQRGSVMGFLWVLWLPPPIFIPPAAQHSLIILWSDAIYSWYWCHEINNLKNK